MACRVCQSREMKQSLCVFFRVRICDNMTIQRKNGGRNLPGVEEASAVPVWKAGFCRHTERHKQGGGKRGEQDGE